MLAERESPASPLFEDVRHIVILQHRVRVAVCSGRLHEGQDAQGVGAGGGAGGGGKE